MGKRGNNEGNITKRADGRWMARLMLPDGSRKYFYATTRQEVSRLLAKAVRDRDSGLPVVGERQTVKEYFTSWLETMKMSLRPRTWKRYEQYVRIHLLPTLGATTLSKLSAQQLQMLYAARLKAGSSRTSIHHLHAVIHKALDAALRLSLVQRNVSELVDPPRIQHHEMATLSPEQAKVFLEAAVGDRFEALYVLALTTGMRQGELLALQWRDVDLEGGTIQVRASLQHTGSEFVFTEPKTAHSRRRVALTRRAIEALRLHRLRQLEERNALGDVWSKDYDMVFPNSIGGPMEDTHLRQREFWPLIKRAGLPPMRFHDLRHTAATLLLGQGINPKIVSEMLGHSQVSITLDIYSHVTPHMQKLAADAMDEVLSD